MRPKPGGQHPSWSVVVSFVGDIRAALGMRDCPLVQPESGQRYRWDWLAGLHAVVCVVPGVDAGDVLRYALGDGWSGMYPTLIDAKANRRAHVTCVAPYRLMLDREQPLRS